MPVAGGLSAADKKRYIEFRLLEGPVAAAREFHIARTTGDTYYKAYLKGPANNPNPKIYADLDREAKRGVKEFRFFAEHYLDLWTVPAWEMVVDYLGAEETNPDQMAFRRTLLTCHPGFGKTTMLLAYLLWRVVRARALKQFSFAATFGSKTEKQTSRAGRQLRSWMNRPQLVMAYGRFRPDTSEAATWSISAMVVAGMDPEKEATIALWSRTESISGVRPQLAIWDDLVDEKNEDPENTTDLVNWWDSVADGRVEPGGTICVSGVYRSPEDFYHQLKDRTFMEEDGSETPMWRHFRFQAHSEALCPGDGTHPVFDPRTNTGCLLNPKRWSYRQLMYYKNNNADVWELQYQQNDLANITVLVPRIWWFGGRTAEGEFFPGCVNKSRSIWEWPREYTLTVASLDPSPTAFIGAGIWDFDAATGVSTLIDVERRRMSPAEYPGFIEDWTKAIRRERPYFEHWIIERTGSVYLLDNEPVMSKLRSLGIQLISHETRANKASKAFGPWGLIQPEAKFGKLDIPYKTADDRFRMSQYEREMLNYDHSRFDDTVMMTWFYLYHRPHLVASRTRAINRWAPGWVKTMSPKPGASLWTPAQRKTG